MKNNQNPAKRNLALLMGVVSGFALLATLALVTLGTREAETFVWVGVLVTMISSTLIATDASSKKSCSPNPSIK